MADESPLTVASLVDEALDTVRGYVRNQDVSTSLATTMNTTDLTFEVSDASQLSSGPVELGDELVQVASLDAVTGVATIEPWGRAQSGSTAASHAIGARVVVSPLYPRQRVRNAIYGVLREIFPKVYAVAQTTLDGNPARTNFSMPSDCFHILSVQTHLPDSTQMWADVRRWRTNKTSTSVEIEILGRTVPGTNRVRILYAKNPPGALSMADDLTTYGYGYELRDLIVLGTTARLLAYTESGRVQALTIESHERSETTGVGGAMAASRQLYAMFQKRVEDEREQLMMRYPMQPHYTR